MVDISRSTSAELPMLSEIAVSVAIRMSNLTPWRRSRLAALRHPNLSGRAHVDRAARSPPGRWWLPRRSGFRELNQHDGELQFSRRTAAELRSLGVL